MNSISEAITSACTALNDGIFSLTQSATDVKVQSVVLRVLATACIVSSVVLVVASLSGRVTMPEVSAVSYALPVIAYGLILGAQYLETEQEIDLSIDFLSDTQESSESEDQPLEAEAGIDFLLANESGIQGSTGDVSSLNSEEFQDAVGEEREQAAVSSFFKIPEQLGDGISVFGNENFVEAMNKLDNPNIQYCFFRDYEEGSSCSRVVSLLYLNKDKTAYVRDSNILERAFDGVDPNTLLDEENLQAFRDKLHRMALDVLSKL